MVMCVSGVCGTGTGNFPQPGDPNMNDSLLTATPAYGGIDLNWSWPNLNPQAVAYTMIWRSIQPYFETANRIVDAAMGSFYYDKVNLELNKDTRYYYWIQMVSVNGTYSEVIGPSSAIANPLIAQMIEQLSGQLDRSVLGQALQQRIDQIELNSLNITAEEIERSKADAGLAVSINTISAKADNALAVLQEEIRLRSDGDGALVQTVNTMYTNFNGNIAAIQQANTALSTRVSALASAITTVNATVNGDIASGQVGLVSTVNTMNGHLINIGAQWTARLDVNGYVGGFGVYNDGRTITAAFNVDEFWVGRAGVARKPFIITNNVVYIDEAAINSLVFSKLRDESGSFLVSGGKIQAKYLQVETLQVNNARSTNYIAGVQGWAFNADGTFEMNGNGGGGRMTITNQLIQIFNAAGALKVRAGIWA